MDLLLKDRVILVTGGSKGMGFACGRILAGEGARVILSSRSDENLRAAANKILSLDKSQVDFVPADLGNEADIDRLVSFITGNYPGLDGLVINSGGPPLGNSLDHTDGVWMQALENQLLAAVRLTRHFIPVMKKQGFGRIVAIASTGVKQALPSLVLSNASRMGLAGYLKTLANEVAASNILINILLPGPTNTERLQDILKSTALKTGKSLEKIIEERTGQVPAGRFGDPEDLASLAAFLLSGRNNFITGQVISVDGGYVRGNL